MAKVNPVRRAKENREYEERGREAFGNRESLIVIDRQGLLRQRIPVSATFHPYLTERQRKVLKGKPRMSRAWVRMLQIMEDTGMTMREMVEGLSVEELVRGQIKDGQGRFNGRPPKWVPREFHRACLEELMRRGRDMWQKNYLGAIEAMTDIARGKGAAGSEATPGERIKAAQFVIERMEGKVPERLVVVEEKRWETVMDGIVAEVSDDAIERGRRALEAAESVMEDIVDAEVIEDEEDYEPDPIPVRSRRRRK